MNIFDFDGTLYQGDSSFDFWKYCLSRYPSTRKRIPLEFLAASKYLLGLLTLDQFKAIFYSYFTEVSSIDAAVHAFWDARSDRLRMDVVGHSQEGDLVVSASPEFLLKPICEILGLQLIASEVDQGSGALLGPNCKGSEKVVRIKAQGFPLRYEKAFSDSLSDTPIAVLADKAYLVTRSGIEPFPFDKTKQ